MRPARRSITDGRPSGRRAWIIVATVAVAGLLAISVAPVAPARAAVGNEEYPTGCPPMTDSIVRIYLGYFNRTPTQLEFADWVRRYSRGEVNLEDISQAVVDSEEFERRHGRPDDSRFVDIVYRNTLRREAPPPERSYWTTVLARGHTRGRMMLAYTEREEFVLRTNTTPPLSGFLRWYPRGSHWYCGVGPGVDLPIEPLIDRTAYADYMFHNGGDTDGRIGISTRLDSTPHLSLMQGSLPPGFTNYTWGGAFDGDGHYGDSLDIVASDDTAWIAVFYPRWIGSQRLGWQIGS